MPPLLGGREPNYGSIREDDHGKGAVIQGETQGPGGLRRVRRVWRYAGGRLPVKSSDDSTWEGGGATAKVDHTGLGKGAPGIPDVLSGKGGTADMPRGGVSGESGDEDGNAGALSAPACPRHRGDDGGRKIPSPTVRPVLGREGADSKVSRAFYIAVTQAVLFFGSET